MSYIKKSVVMFLVSAILGGGAWYLNTTGVIGGISSSALTTASNFSCTQDALKKQASTYRTIVTRNKKALVIKKKLEAEITALKVSDPQTQLQKKEETLKILVRQINTYLRFIRKYDTCKKEIKLNPAVSSGIMSGEAKVIVSEKEYQALAAFKIESPKGLNTYITSLQFKIEVLPVAGVVVDKWFLLHEGTNPILCQSTATASQITCEFSGDMPVDIMSGTSRNYGIGAHITAVTGSGTIDIQIANITFNANRTYSNTSASSAPLGFGVVVPVVEEARVPTPVISPSVVPVNETPVVTTPPAATEASNPTVQPSVTAPITSSDTAPAETIPVVQPSIVTDETPVVTTPPTSSDIVPPPATSEASTPVVQPAADSIVPASSATPPENAATAETV